MNLHPASAASCPAEAEVQIQLPLPSKELGFPTLPAPWSSEQDSSSATAHGTALPDALFVSEEKQAGAGAALSTKRPGVPVPTVCLGDPGTCGTKTPSACSGTGHRRRRREHFQRGFLPHPRSRGRRSGTGTPERGRRGWGCRRPEPPRRTDPCARAPACRAPLFRLPTIAPRPRVPSVPLTWGRGRGQQGGQSRGQQPHGPRGAGAVPSRPVPSLRAEPTASSPPRPPFSPRLSSPPLSPPFFSAFSLPSPFLSTVLPPLRLPSSFSRLHSFSPSGTKAR